MAFFSRQLKGAELNYSVTELESLATVAAVSYFDYYLYGRTVTVFTDHRACVSLLTSSHLNKRLMWFALKLQDRDISIKF